MITGIDLGTVNSACAVWQDGAARLVARLRVLTDDAAMRGELLRGSRSAAKPFK